MLVLSLTQPRATLVAIQAKQIETRSFQRSYRGPLAIHASKGLAGLSEEEYRALARSHPYFGPALQAGGYPMAGIKHFDNLPRGAIVAVCELETCMPTTWITATGRTTVHTIKGPLEYVLTDQERAFGDYSAGRFAWLLSNIYALPEPIPAKGALGLWQMDAETEQAVRRQLALAPAGVSL